MKKLKDGLLNAFYAFGLIVLALWFFWEGVAKPQVKHLIDRKVTEDYGYYIMQTYNDCQLIKNFNLPTYDEGKDTTIRQ